jgi:hypothetical protein
MRAVFIFVFPAEYLFLRTSLVPEMPSQSSTFRHPRLGNGHKRHAGSESGESAMREPVAIDDVGSIQREGSKKLLVFPEAY